MALKDVVDKETEQAHAYTPGLKVKREEIIRKTRRLPILGDVLVEEGEDVDFDTIVARTEVPGDPVIIRADDMLGLASSDVPHFMLKKVDEKVEEGEVIARYSPFFGLFKKELKSPVTGSIETISEETGQVVIRGSPIPVEINSYIRGKIAEIIPDEGVIVETKAAFIQGIFGVGGERHGELLVVSGTSEDVLSEDDILPEHKGKILIGGRVVTLEALKKASQCGVNGIVVGGIKGDDLGEYLGYKIGVAITGEEDINFTVVVTEGFGEMSMSERTFKIMKELNGRHAAINGTTQIRAGVLRPEIIIPHKGIEQSGEELKLALGMQLGTTVRIIADPYFGEIGEVVRLPVKLQRVQTGSDVRVVEVRLISDEIVTVPRANVEIIEE